ncbi:hypothetical protein P6709_20415, partial [Jeotgalibacillus sp. ET6]|uniref:hypothetical protein n=1 Tax=Jeotgalibacillus sp. ET6 TaxID=3037260 RepID=UPI002418BBF5
LKVALIEHEDEEQLSLLLFTSLIIPAAISGSLTSFFHALQFVSASGFLVIIPIENPWIFKTFDFLTSFLFSKENSK